MNQNLLFPSNKYTHSSCIDRNGKTIASIHQFIDYFHVCNAIYNLIYRTNAIVSASNENILNCNPSDFPPWPVILFLVVMMRL